MIKALNTSSHVKGLKWITSNYRDGASWLLIIADSEQISSADGKSLVLKFSLRTGGKEKVFTSQQEKPPKVSGTCLRPCLMNKWAVQKCLLCLARWEEHYPRNFMHLKTFCPQFCWGRHTHTHSHIHQLITRKSKPHTRGPWSPWSPCKRKEK